MDKVINLHGKKYISAKRASEITGYTSDYVGQLCRAKKVSAKLIGRSWYVLKGDILKHKNSNKKSYDNISPKPSLVSDRNKEKRERVTSKVLEPTIFKSKSRIGEIVYIKDNSPLFPIITKVFDHEKEKYIALEIIEKSLGKSRQALSLKKFAVGVSIVLLCVSSFIFGGEKIAEFIPSNFERHLKSEILFLYDPYLNSIRNGYSKFKENILSINQKGDQLASSVFSVGGWQSISGWAKDTAYKIIKPWLLRKDKSVLVDSSKGSSQGNYEPIAKSIVITGSDREYIDFQIEELKKYFLTLPLISSTAPNINRYYITNQNDRVVDNLSRPITKLDGATIINSSFSGSSVSAEEGLFSSLSISGPAAFTGSTTMADLSVAEWLAVGTTTRQDTLTLDGAFYMASIDAPADTSSRLYHINNGDLYWDGNLIGGATTGNWATDGTHVWRENGNVGIGTTSPYAKLAVEHLSTTGTVIGTDALTGFTGNLLDLKVASTSKFTVDYRGNLTSANLITSPYSSSTAYSSFVTASTTNLIIGGQSFNNLLGSGLSNVDGALTNTGLLSYDAWTHPLSGYSATTSSLVIGASSSPYALLSVSNYSPAGNTAPLFVVASSTGTSATSTAFIINSVGNVGIGTVTPGSTLQVSGTVTASSFQTAGVVYGIFKPYGSSADLVLQQQNNSYNFVFKDSGNNALVTLTGGGLMGIGTTTPQYLLNPYSATLPQLSLSAGAGVSQWAMRNAGGNLYLSTTTVAGTATTSVSALEIAGDGFGTTTVRGLNISGQATTTSNVGINLSGGCYGINGTCLSLSSLGGSPFPFDVQSWGVSTTTTIGLLNGFLSTASSTINSSLYLPSLSQGFLYTGSSGLVNTAASSSLFGFTPISNQLTKGNFIVGDDSGAAQATSSIFISSTGMLGIGTSSPFATLSVSNYSPAGNTAPLFVVASSTGTSATSTALIVTSTGNVGIGTTAPGNKLVVLPATGGEGIMIRESDNGADAVQIEGWTNGGIIQVFNGGGPIIQFDGSSATAYSYLNGGFVGIGTTTPGAKLSVTNAAGATTPAFLLSTSTAGYATSTAFIIDSNGKVGIGTSTPYTQLSVQGGVAGDYFTANGLSASVFPYASSTYSSFATASTTNLVIGGQSLLSLDGTGLSVTGNILNVSDLTTSEFTSADISQWTNDAGYVSYAWPFTPDTTYNILNSATSTAIWAQAGINASSTSHFSQASSTLLTVAGNAYFGIVSEGSWEGSSVGISFGGTNATSFADNTLLSFDGTRFVSTSTPTFGIFNATSTAATSTIAGGVNIGGTGLIYDYSSGRVGIGTAAPTGLLDVNSKLIVSSAGFGTTTLTGLNINAQATTTSNVGINLSGGCFAINNTCITGGSGLSSYDAWTHPWFGSSATTSSLIVGTSTSALYSLTVASSTKPQLALSAGVGIAQWTFRNAGGNFYLSTTTVAGTATTTTSALTIIGSTGNIGIGSTTPWAQFSINPNLIGANTPAFAVGSSTATMFSITSAGPGTNSGAIFNYGTLATSTILSNAPYAWTVATSSSANSPILHIQTGTGQKATTTAYGSFQVSIPDVTDGIFFRVDANTGIASLDAMEIGTMGFDTDAGIVSWINMPSSTTTAGLINSYSAMMGGTPVLTVYGTTTSSGTISYGHVGIGTTSPWQKFSIDGTGAWNGLTAAASGNIQVCINNTSKLLYLGASASSCTPSSKRYKNSIDDSLAGLDVLMQLRPVTFYFNDGGDSMEQIGFIAEEVHAIDPRLVQLDAEKLPYALRLDSFLPVLTKSIQELDTRTNSFSSSTSGLEAMVRDLIQTSSNTSLTLESLKNSLNILASTTASTTDKLALDISSLNSRLSMLEASSTSLALFFSNPEGLTIEAPLTLNTGLKVDHIASINDYLLLVSDTEFIGRPYFTKDTAGFAIIRARSREVEVIFEREYLEQPIVNAAISFELASSSATSTVPFGNGDIEEQIFADDIRFLVTNKSARGFKILLNKPAPADVPFGWIALAVKTPKVFESALVDPMLNAGGEIPSEVIILNPNLSNPDVESDAGGVAGAATSTPDTSATSTPTALPEPATTSTEPIVGDAATSTPES